ncbi:MAG TPA: hypothetical protein VGC36_10900, partial [Rhizomicrobium sp.]
MAVTALYTIAMSPAEAFEYTRGALAAAGAAPGVQSPPSLLEFSLAHKDPNLGGSLEAVMRGRAVIAPDGEARSAVTLSIEPATEFILYAAGIGLAAALFGNWFLGTLSGLWVIFVLSGEAYLFWAAFNKWPNEAMAKVHTRMRASEKVSGGEPAAPIFTPPARPATANA